MIITGTYLEGFGTGAGFVRLAGYGNQFREKLGIEGDFFPGTFNVELDALDYKHVISRVHKNGVLIEGFVDDKLGKRFYPVKCLECRIDGLADRAFIILPQKSRYTKIIEIVSPAEIRNALGGIEPGTLVELEFQKSPHP